MSLLADSVSFEYLCYGSTAVRNIFILSVRGPCLFRVYTSDSIRQSLTYKDGPRAVGLSFNVSHYDL